MISVVLSIRPEWARRIYDRNKVVEVRRQQLGGTSGPVHVYLYETLPVGRVTGDAVLIPLNGAEGDIEPEDWACLACLSEDEFRHYGGADPHCYRITQLQSYDRTLADLGVAHAPQSWCYVPRLGL